MRRALRRAMPVLFLAASLGCAHRAAAPARPAAPVHSAESDAFAAAEAWLARVDEARYGESWDAASSLFRQRITREQWIALARGVRSSLGAVVSRDFQSSDYAQSESRPAVLLVWKSEFAAFPSAVEQVTMILEDDGAWRCAGYFVRKR